MEWVRGGVGWGYGVRVRVRVREHTWAVATGEPVHEEPDIWVTTTLLGGITMSPQIPVHE